ncbi:outer membrane beta-barrel protein [Xanthocytophaga flava]|uniref:outer membrane beta-barrel protein n=1 Tax=Xanthocytophaga flava TaxID=3048013 RepID=UPI0028D1A83B|nr:outer membrane beta-barrel protein [Xanthocytophaga flavus]MDJ1468356.1 outer membrane beta-barrel protein [Xanthocytophaga flavus]
MRKVVLLALAATALFFNANAQDSTPATTEEDKGKFTFSGYLDSYYLSNFNKPLSRRNTGASGLDEGVTVGGGNARAFDYVAGQFSLGLVQTKAVYSNKKSEAVIDLTFGPNADMGNYGNYVGPLGGGSTALGIKQAYFTYKATDKLSFTAGQFGTHIGYEVIDAPINYNYSLSNLFNNGPFYHIGLKGTYAFSDKVALMAGIVNNIDNLNDNNRAKAIISQLYVQPVSGWNVYLNWIGSNEAPSSTSIDGAYYSLFDLTTSYQITEKFFMGLNAAMGSEKGGSGQDASTWGGVALYSNVAISDVFGLGARYEYFDNTSGVRGVRNGLGAGTTVNSVTVTGNFTLADGHLLIKPEYRLDSYPKLSGGGNEQHQKFEDSDGVFSKNTQSTLTLAFIYKF